MILIETFGERQIAVKGIGKMYYQDGFPIEMSIFHLRDKGIEVSLFHVADELLKNGFPAKRVIAILNSEGIYNVDEFCNSDYERQREMIFNYLFENKENGCEWLRCKLKKIG